MASTAGPIASSSPMSPAIKRSTRKRQRPSFFADEIAVAATPSSTKKHSSQRASSASHVRHPKQASHPAPAPHSHAPARRARSDLSQLHDTVAGLRAQIESATEQMQELRSLVTMLADLYRGDEISREEPTLFSPASTTSVDDAHDTDGMFSTTASEYDVGEDDEQDELFKTPLSPL